MSVPSCEISIVVRKDKVIQSVIVIVFPADDLEIVYSLECWSSTRIKVRIASFYWCCVVWEASERSAPIIGISPVFHEKVRFQVGMPVILRELASRRYRSVYSVIVGACIVVGNLIL